MLAGKEATFKPRMGAFGAACKGPVIFNRSCGVFEAYRLLFDAPKCISIRVVWQKLYVKTVDCHDVCEVLISLLVSRGACVHSVLQYLAEHELMILPNLLVKSFGFLLECHHIKDKEWGGEVEWGEGLR